MKKGNMGCVLGLLFVVFLPITIIAKLVKSVS